MIFLACASEGLGHRRLVSALHDGSWKGQRSDHTTQLLDEDFLKVLLKTLLVQFPLGRWVAPAELCVHVLTAFSVDLELSP